MPESFQYTSNATPAELAARISACTDACVITHQKPDGDAMGSLLAAVRMCRALGKRAVGYVAGAVDPNIQSLAEPGEVRHVSRGLPGSSHDLIIIVDTGSRSQLEPYLLWLEPLRDRVILIDHHRSGDDLAALRLVRPECASATMVVADVVRALDISMVRAGGNAHRSIAEAMFAGLATDTGWFRFSSADSAAFALASELLALGVDKSTLYRQLEENERPERLAATAQALGSLRFLQAGRIAVMQLRPEDFERSKARPEDIGGVVNSTMMVGSVCVSILMTEQERGITKMSFRSKPRGGGQPYYDVNVLAGQFNGGGHSQAAGGRVKLSMDEAWAMAQPILEAYQPEPPQV